MYKPFWRATIFAMLCSAAGVSSAEVLDFSISDNSLASGDFSFDTTSSEYLSFEIVSASSGIDYSEFVSDFELVGLQFIPVFSPSDPTGDAQSVSVLGSTVIDPLGTNPQSLCGVLTITFNGALDSADPGITSASEALYQDLDCVSTPVISNDNSGMLITLTNAVAVPLPAISYAILAALLFSATRLTKKVSITPSGRKDQSSLLATRTGNKKVDAGN